MSKPDIPVTTIANKLSAGMLWANETRYSLDCIFSLTGVGLGLEALLEVEVLRLLPGAKGGSSWIRVLVAAGI